MTSFNYSLQVKEQDAARLSRSEKAPGLVLSQLGDEREKSRHAQPSLQTVAAPVFALLPESRQALGSEWEKVWARFPSTHFFFGAASFPP
jgi:hypothetical protein